MLPMPWLWLKKKNRQDFGLVLWPKNFDGVGHARVMGLLPAPKLSRHQAEIGVHKNCAPKRGRSDNSHTDFFMFIVYFRYFSDQQGSTWHKKTSGIERVMPVVSARLPGEGRT